MVLSDRGKVLFITSIGSFITPFTSTFLSFAVPAMGHSLHAPFTLMIWVPIAYLIPLTSLLIVLGKLSDSYGRSKMYQLGLIIFGAGAVLAPFTGNIYLLIGCILVMGFGTSFLAVNTIAIVSTVYPTESRGKALGINAMSVYLGLTSAPTVSGFIVDFASWQYMFYLIALVGFLLVVPARVCITRMEVQSKKEPIDLAGFFLFLLAILLVVLYLSFSEVYGWYRTVYLLAGGLLLISALVLFEREKENPILDLRLFTSSRTFTAANFTAFLNYISTFAIVFVFSIYLNVIENLKPSTTGLILTAQPVMMVIFSPISGRLSDRFGSRVLASLGMLLISIALISIYFMIGNSSPFDLVWPFAVVGVGFGLFSAPNTNAVMGSIERKDSGSASGILGTMRFIGQLMSISIMGSILAAAMPRTFLLELFAGVPTDITLFDKSAFMNGTKEAMLLGGILSLLGVFTSLVRNR